MYMVLSPDLSGVYIASSITCAILKAICARVGFGSGTETSMYIAMYITSITNKHNYVHKPYVHKPMAGLFLYQESAQIHQIQVLNVIRQLCTKVT